MGRFTLALDASKINEYLTCPRMWYWRYYRNLVYSGRKTKALDKGTLIHCFADMYYNFRALDPTVNPMSHVNAVLGAIKATQKEMRLEKEEFEFLKMRFLQYGMRYMQNDIRPSVKKGKPAVELGFSKVLKETPDVLYVVEGRIDLIGTYAGVELFMDHKTQAQAKDLYQFIPQFKTYAWATGLNRGMINYIGLQAEVNDKTFRRQLVTFPSWMIANWEKKMISVFDAIRIDLESGEEWFETSPYSMNDHACGGSFNSAPCMFTRLCETHDRGIRESIIKQNYEIRIWQPWGADEATIEEVA